MVDNVVGVHQVGKSQQKLKTMTGEVAAALHSLVALRLAENKHAVRLTDEELWELSVGDLGRQVSDTIVLGGRIREFSVYASTIAARVKTEYEFILELDCYVGRVDEEKVIKRTVRFSQKMLNISHSSKVMDTLLDKFLEEAALQVAENVESFL